VVAWSWDCGTRVAETELMGKKSWSELMFVCCSLWFLISAHLEVIITALVMLRKKPSISFSPQRNSVFQTPGVKPQAAPWHRAALESPGFSPGLSKTDDENGIDSILVICALSYCAG
jgi:hypothetical protein